MRDFVWIADNAYTKAEIIDMEVKILNTLGFNLGTPLPLHFLRRYSKASAAEEEVHTVAKYIMELSFGEYSLACTHSSKLAAASMCIAREIVVPTEAAWTPALQYYSGYSVDEICSTVGSLTKVCIRVCMSEDVRVFGCVFFDECGESESI